MKIEKKKQHLIKILTKLVETNIELMTMLREMSTDTKSKQICSKNIRQSRQALKILPITHHIEILQSLYNTLIVGKENIFALSGTLISSKNFKKWDTTKKGFQEFLELEQQAKEKQEQEIRQKQENMEAIKKAKEQGKKVEMVFDPTTKKVKPLIVEQKSEA